jgi:hypothetical protein
VGVNSGVVEASGVFVGPGEFVAGGVLTLVAELAGVGDGVELCSGEGEGVSAGTPVDVGVLALVGALVGVFVASGGGEGV